jgi:hypothetical protein
MDLNNFKYFRIPPPIVFSWRVNSMQLVFPYVFSNFIHTSGGHGVENVPK